MDVVKKVFDVYNDGDDVDEDGQLTGPRVETWQPFLEFLSI